MSYKPDESVMMAYLYDELSAEEKVLVEKYLLENPAAAKEMESFRNLRKALSVVGDKEVIAPPIVVEDQKQRFLWNAPYFKTIVGIAASLLLLMIAGKVMDLQLNYSNNQVSLSFGDPVKAEEPVSGLSADEVQQMINASMSQNNQFVQTSLDETQKKLDASIRQNLAVNSAKINTLVKEASRASQDEIRLFVAGLQSQNQQLVKDYFQLSTTDQQKYIEGLLVDFTKYLQQQRNNDLQTLQTRLTSIEQNTTVFKQETEQILASIISNNTPANTNKNY